MIAWLLRRWAAIAVLLAGLALYLKGRSDPSAKADAKESAAYRDTRKDIDDAQADLGDDPATLRDWLRTRSKQR